MAMGGARGGAMDVNVPRCSVFLAGFWVYGGGFKSINGRHLHGRHRRRYTIMSHILLHPHGCEALCLCPEGDQPEWTADTTDVVGVCVCVCMELGGLWYRPCGERGLLCTPEHDACLSL